MRTLILILSLVTFGCMSTNKIAPLAVPEQGAIPDSSRYVENGRLIAGPPLSGLHFAPSKGTCAPGARLLGFTACCEGNSCNGHCVYKAEGGSACSCFGEVGGCKEDETCSKLAHRCVKTDEVRPR